MQIPPYMSERMAGGKNILVLSNLVAFTEGTDNGRQETKDFGYDVLVGGRLFTSYAKHPDKLVHLNDNLSSTAAGRYQILHRFWVHYQRILGLPDFSPLSQDRYFLHILKERKATDLILQGKVSAAILRINNIWASLPGSPYGQHTYSMDFCLKKFVELGGTVSE